MPAEPRPIAEDVRLEAQLLRILVPPLTLLLLLGALLAWQVYHLLVLTAWVERSGEVIATGNALYRRLVDEETGLRGFLVAGQRVQLQPYHNGQMGAEHDFQALQRMVADDPKQVEILERLRLAHGAWERKAEEAIRLRDAGRPEPMTGAAMLEGKRGMDALRAQVEAFLDHERQIRQARVSAVQRQTHRTIGVGAGTFLLVAAGLAAISRRRLRAVSAIFVRAADAEARLRRFWDSNILGVLYTDAAGNITAANDAVLRMLGYTREEVEAGGLRWSEITPEEFAAVDARAIAESFQKGACTPYEKAYRAKDGRLVPILIGYALLDGSRADYIGFVIDLTERKRAEQALAEQHAITRTITDNATSALFMVDARGYCTYMNPAAEAMIGYSFEEIRQRPLHDVIHHERADGSPYPLAECPLHRVLVAGTFVHGHEDLFTRKDGTRLPAVCAAGTILRDGVSVGVVIEMRDIREQKRIEAERKHLLDSERAARAAAERAVRLKDDFLSVLSHELRTPLNAILGWTSMVKKGTLGPEAMVRALEVIERSALAEARLIEDMLDVSRITAGKLRLEPSRVDLAKVVEAAVDAVRPAAQAKQIRLEKIIGSSVPPVLADPERIQQVVWNLLSNAIKFTPKGGRVAVTLLRVESSAEIAVSDSGQGIAEEFLPHVFERFRQADASSTRRHGGLGLGLALVRQLVELHGGTVRAASEGVGRGATFTIRLPITAIHAPDEEARTSPDACELLAGVRVLVVDDEEDTRELVRRLLADCHADVVVVDSASAALDEVQRFRPDVLVSDIGMPDEDGYQLLRSVRALDREHGGRTPAAALTAYARPEDRIHVLRAGYQVHMAKPVNARELITVVANLAGRLAEPGSAVLRM